MTGSAAPPSEDAILGISEICYLFSVSRSQLFEWRRRPDFPPARETKYGFIGFRFGDVATWVASNQRRLRRHQAPDTVTKANRLPMAAPCATSACETQAI